MWWAEQRVQADYSVLLVFGGQTSQWENGRATSARNTMDVQIWQLTIVVVMTGHRNDGQKHKNKIQALKDSKEGQYHGMFVYSSLPRYYSLQLQSRIKISHSVQRHGNKIMMWWLWWMINLMQASASRFSWHNEVRWLPDCSSRIMNQSSVTAHALTLLKIPMLFI